MRFFRSENLALSDFPGIWLCREFSLLLYPPTSFYQPRVRQIQWYVAERRFSSHALGRPFLSGSRCMPNLTSGGCGIRPGSWSGSLWYTALCCTVASVPGIVSGWSVSRIDLRIRASSWSLGTQWGLILSWPPERWRPFTPSPVGALLSDLK